MRFQKYRFVKLESDKVIPHYSGKMEAKTALKELRLIKREIRLEKHKLQNRKKQLNILYTQEIREYLNRNKENKKAISKKGFIANYKSKKKETYSIRKEKININIRKLEIIISEIENEIIKMQAKILHM
jgi:hypothetical protein